MEDTKEGPPQLSPLRQRQARRIAEQQNREPREPGTITRRQLFKGVLGAAGVIATSGIVATTLSRLGESTTQTASAKPLAQPTILPQLDKPVVEPGKKVETITDKELLNKILSLPLDSLERKNLEQEYFNRVKTVEQVDLGLGALFYYKKEGEKVDDNWHLRRELIDKRFDLRQKEDPTLLTKIGKERTKWLEERKLHPAGVDMVLTAKEKAKRVIAHELATPEGRKKFKAAIAYEESIGNLPRGYLANMPFETLVENCLINMGGALRLLSTETGWAYQKDATYPDFAGEKVLISYPFINLGNTPAMSQLNQKNQQAFKTLCERAQKATGVIINPDYYPGSTAGAVITQIMPESLLIIADEFKKAGETFIFNNPIDAIAAMFVFLAQEMEFLTEKGIDYRYGYLKGDEPILDKVRKKALFKWNQVDEQIDIIYGDANDYYDKFLATHKYRQ